MTQDRLLNATTGTKFDAVHFVAHGDDEGIDMVSWKMAPKQVAQICNHVRAGFVFLNICRSVFLPQYLIDQHIPAVLSHTLAAGVDDRQALQIASYFYEEVMRQNGDFHRAYDIISPRDGTLAWSSNGAYLGVLEPVALGIAALEKREQRRERWLRYLTAATGINASVVVAGALSYLAGHTVGQSADFLARLIVALLTYLLGGHGG